MIGMGLRACNLQARKLQALWAALSHPPHLRLMQTSRQVRKRKWENYSSGEELFGLPVTQYPELEQTEKEIQMLDRLYSLYVTVITTIKGYGDYFWVDVVEKIDEMGEQVCKGSLSAAGGEVC